MNTIKTIEQTVMEASDLMEAKTILTDDLQERFRCKRFFHNV